MQCDVIDVEASSSEILFTQNSLKGGGGERGGEGRGGEGRGGEGRGGEERGEYTLRAEPDH